MKPVVEANDFFSTWLMAEAADHDAIKVKRVYIDINDGNLIDGVLFSQIMYWHGINRETGKPRMTIVKDKHLWLAREYNEWFDECRVNYESARASIGRIVKRGLLVKKVYRFNGMATVHIRIDPEAFEKAIRTVQNKPSETAINRKPRKSTKTSADCDTVPHRNGIQSQTGMVSNRKPLTETTAQTTAETPLSQSPNGVATDALAADFDEQPVASKELHAYLKVQQAKENLAAPEPEAKREQADPEQDTAVKERMAIQERETSAKEKDSSAGLPPPPDGFAWHMVAGDNFKIHLARPTPSGTRLKLACGQACHYPTMVTDKRFIGIREPCLDCQRKAAELAAQPLDPTWSDEVKDALAKLCKRDWKIPAHKKAMNGCLASISQREPVTLDKLRRAYRNWYKCIYKGMQGQAPEPYEVTNKWVELTEAEDCKEQPNNGRNNGRYQPDDYVQDPYFKSEEFLNQSANPETIDAAWLAKTREARLKAIRGGRNP